MSSIKENQNNWLNNLSNKWKSEKIRNIFEERVEKNNQNNEDFLSILKDVGVVKYSEKGNSGNKTSDKIENYKMVYKGDIVINPMNVTIGSAGCSNYNGCLSSVYIVLKPKKKINTDYYHYIFLNKEFQKHLKKISSGLMEIRESIDKVDFFSEKIPFPPLEDQNLIAEYLKKKIKKIDLLIKKITKKTELYKDKFNSSIEKLITKGLQGNVKFKDSKIDWVGEIPINWTLEPLFNLFYENKTKNKKKSLDILTLSYGEIKLRDISILDGLYPENFDSYQVVNPNYIIIRSTDLQNDHKSLRVGYASISGVITSAYLGLICKKNINTKYFYYYFHLSDLKKVLYGLGGGVRQSLSYDDFKRFPLICPPEEEQNQIVNILDKMKNDLKIFINKNNKKIELLKEYKNSLIKEIVLGKTKITKDII